jgi:tetratricopeptide (TPR) repeat protein
MKNWSSSSLFLLFVVPLAWAGDASDGHICLDAVNLPCAQKQRDELMQDRPDEATTLGLHARTLFHEGRYSELSGVLGRLDYPENDSDWVPADGMGPGKQPYRATISAALGLMETERGGIRVRHGTGVETILVEDALDTLERSKLYYDEVFGGTPSHDLVMDIFPTASRFILASGLPPEAVRATGVIALSKWNRLLLTSPRAMSRGYGWRDTAAHEYIHLVVAWCTDDQAPVWLQEGLAKYFEAGWRGGKGDYLSVHQQSLLAKALREDAFVPFEKFRYSMAYLDSSEEAALAFAQVASMMDFLSHKAGDDAFPKLMLLVRSGRPSEESVAELAGFGDFAAFRAGWKEYLGTLPLVKETLEALPVALDGEGGDFADDPLLSQRQDLAKFVRLGDLLLEIDRPKAALVEYEKVEEEEGPPSPNLLARKSRCHMAMGDLQTARDLAETGVRFYPEYALLQVTLAKILGELGDSNASVQAWAAAHELNPFNPEVQKALALGYEVLNQPELAARHRKYGRILATGGATTTGE